MGLTAIDRTAESIARFARAQYLAPETLLAANDIITQSAGRTLRFWLDQEEQYNHRLKLMATLSRTSGDGDILRDYRAMQQMSTEELQARVDTLETKPCQ